MSWVVTDDVMRLERRSRWSVTSRPWRCFRESLQQWQRKQCTRHAPMRTFHPCLIQNSISFKNVIEKTGNLMVPASTNFYTREDKTLSIFHPPRRVFSYFRWKRFEWRFGWKDAWWVLFHFAFTFSIIVKFFFFIFWGKSIQLWARQMGSPTTSRSISPFPDRKS